MIKVRNSLVGQTLGNFLVLSRAEDYISPNGARRTQWLCKCLLCNKGTAIIVDTVLRKGTKASCGCLEDLTGRDFGNLHVLEKAGKSSNGATLWKCQCTCSNFITVEHSRLVSGKTRSCGCFRREAARVRFSKTNVFDLTGDYGIGYTTNTNQPFYFDLSDYALIKDFTWCENVDKNGYHSIKTKDKTTGKLLRMSQVIGCKYHDHIDRNPLNNRRSNFRPATSSENAMNRSKSSANTSGYTGVCWDKSAQKWVAYITLDSRMKKLGRFKEKEDAIKARLEAEAKYYKEFAPQRHLFEKYNIKDDFINKEGN